MITNAILAGLTLYLWIRAGSMSYPIIKQCLDRNSGCSVDAMLWPASLIATMSAITVVFLIKLVRQVKNLKKKDPETDRLRPEP